VAKADMKNGLTLPQHIVLHGSVWCENVRSLFSPHEIITPAIRRGCPLGEDSTAAWREVSRENLCLLRLLNASQDRKAKLILDL